MANEIINLLAEQVEQHGWAVNELFLPHGILAATKFFNILHRGGSDAIVRCFNGVLTGEYYSEGNNALSTCIVFVKPTDDAKQIVASFLQDVEKRIDATYGRRLRGV
jgi:hypothetical protein